MEEQLSTKFRAVITILEHHLKEDGLPPLVTPGAEPGEDNILASAPDATKDPRTAGMPRDKIILFVAFPANLEVILPVGVFIVLLSAYTNSIS